MSNQHAPSIHSLRTVLLTNLIYVAILPLVIYHFASPYMSTMAALLLAALPAAIYTLLGLIRYKRLNLLAIFALLSIAVKLISALVFKDARLLLISDSLITGTNGIILLISLLLGKPLLLIIAKNMLATTPSQQNEQSAKRWQEARYSSFFALLTAIVGAGLLIEFVMRLVLVYTLSITQFLVVSPLVHYGLLGLLLLCIVLFVRHRRQSQQPEPIPQQETAH